MSEETGTQMGEQAGEHTYESAVARLEAIIARLDSGEAELRETLELCREAKELIEFARSELDEVSGALRELNLDELVAGLEPGAPDSQTK